MSYIDTLQGQLIIAAWDFDNIDQTVRLLSDLSAESQALNWSGPSTADIDA